MTKASISARSGEALGEEIGLRIFATRTPVVSIGWKSEGRPFTWTFKSPAAAWSWVSKHSVRFREIYAERSRQDLALSVAIQSGLTTAAQMMGCLSTSHLISAQITAEIRLLNWRGGLAFEVTETHLLNGLRGGDLRMPRKFGARDLARSYIWCLEDQVGLSLGKLGHIEPLVYDYLTNLIQKNDLSFTL